MKLCLEFSAQDLYFLLCVFLEKLWQAYLLRI